MNEYFTTLQDKFIFKIFICNTSIFHQSDCSKHSARICNKQLQCIKLFWMTCECQIIMFNYSIDLKARFPENPFLGQSVVRTNMITEKVSKILTWDFREISRTSKAREWTSDIKIQQHCSILWLYAYIIRLNKWAFP